MTYFWLNQPSGLITFGHYTYFKQMLTSTKTSLQRAKRQDITYVGAALRRRPLQLSLLLDKGLVFSPTGLDLTTLYPRMFQKSNQQKTQQVQTRMIVHPMMTAGQKQFSPCPTLERAATVDSTEVVNSSRNLRASR